jgi:hypothetical protein
MNKTSSRGNGNGAVTGVRLSTETIESNPYLQHPPDEARDREHHADQSDLDELSDEDQGYPIDAEDEERKVNQRRRRVVLVAAMLFVTATLVIVLIAYYRSATRVEYGKRTKQREVLPPPPNMNQTTGRDSRTERAIEEAQRLTAGNAATPRPVPAGGKEDIDKATSGEIPFTAPPASNGSSFTVDPTNTTAQTTPGIVSRAELDRSNDPPLTEKPSEPSHRSSETSLYIGETSASRPSPAKADPANKVAPVEKGTRTVTLPPFASVLPVRTVGALFTLRTGALVRLELTRDIKGDGWSMKRGTLLVGTTKGGDLDRAYVSVLGFIDPHSGKLVKLGGEVRGGDGGEGLKGKRRQLESGWARALAGISNAGVAITTALLSGRADTVIVSDGLRSRAVNPIADEVTGVFGSEVNRRREQGFVEVLAGTPGYVMVTDLPAILRGTEANPELDEKSLALLTDVDATRPSTGLSERELAELLASGSPDEIRAAMPKMTSEMRNIAAALLPP